jgi:hypothetical protein
MLRAADSMKYDVKKSTRDNLSIMGQGLLIDPAEHSANKP